VEKFDLEEEFHSLLFGVKRSVRYHDRRCNFFSILHCIFLLKCFSRREGLHRSLKVGFINLQKKMVMASVGVIDEFNFNDFQTSRLKIEEKEPPILHVLNMICHNEMIRAEGYEEKYFIKISWLQRKLAHFFDINEYKLTYDNINIEEKDDGNREEDDGDELLEIIPSDSIEVPNIDRRSIAC